MATSNRSPTVESADATFAGPGEAREHARAVDWSATPLGAPESWPTVLRAAIQLCMASLTPMAIWAGPEFTLIYNDPYGAVLRDKAPWAMGRPGREIDATIEAEMQAVVRTRIATRHEDEPYIIRVDGHEELGFYTYTLTPLQDDDGRVVGIFNVCEETSAIRSALARTQDKYRTLVDAMDVGFCVVEVRNGHYRILEANRAFEKHTGLRDPVGKLLGDIFPKPAADSCNLCERVAVTGEPGRLELPPVKFGRYLEVHAFRVGAAAERHVAMLFTDISDRKRAEADLHDREARQAFLLALTDTLRPLRDPDEIERIATRGFGEYLGANRVLYADIEDGKHSVVTCDYTNGVSSIIGRPVAVTVGRLRDGNPLIINDVDTDSRLSATERAAFHAMDVAAAMSLGLVKDGRWVAAFAVHSAMPRTWTQLDISLLEEFGERVWAFVERARAEQALRELDQRKSEFLAVLSHELRNPLAPIRTSVELLEHVPPQSESAARARGILSRQTAHLARLVDDLLDLTRISHGKITLQRHPLDLREIVQQTTDDLRPIFEGRGVALNVELPAGPAWVNGDEVRLAEVLSNLLENAVKFTPAGGRVTVTLVTADGRAAVSVRDTGEGIDPAQIEHMFEPFAQVSQGIARTRGGLGLGLPLVKSFTELHGGTVHASSRGLGHGAEFVVTLPLEPRSEPLAAAQPVN